MLSFDEHGLDCIDVIIKESRDFFIEEDGGDVEEEVREAIETEFITSYTDAFEVMTVIMGPPDFQKTEPLDDEAEGYEEEISFLREGTLRTLWCTWMLAYWDKSDNVLQIKLEHEDTELPIIFTCAAMRPD